MNTKHSKYDIFISYRREGGYETALPIVEKLRSAGYRVFFDLETMNPGKFNEQLISVINNCTDFILVLPAHGLDRCSDPNDWVRREIECALTTDKNIIPVMLNGFTWPETLPESMAELPNYQGISATTPEYFDLAIERLKGYLRSTPRKPWKRWMAYTGSVAGCILMLALFGWVAFTQMAKPVAKEASTRLTLAMNVVHEMYSVNEDFTRAWNAYISRRNKAIIGERSALDQDFIENIDKYYIPNIRSIAAKYPDFKPFSTFDRKLLGYYDVDAPDIDGLPFIVSSHADEFVDNFNLHRIIIQQGALNDATIKSLQQSDECDVYGRNMIYYTYLSELAKFPIDARASHREAVKSWNLYPTVSESMKSEDYKQMAAAEMSKLEKAVKAKEMLFEMLGNKTNQLEEYLNDLQIEMGITDFDELPDGRESSDVEATLERIAAKRKAIDSLEQKRSEADRQLREQFESYKTKFAIQPSDEQYYKWGKIIKAANYLNLTVSFNEQRQAVGDKPSITNAEALDYVDQQLDAYCSCHPETRKYVDAAKAYYAEVANGHRRMYGVLMMGTQNNESHPLLQVGDIILERNGRQIDSAETYSAAASLSTPGTIKFLRLIDGRLKEMSENYPDCKINIGLLALADQ